MSHAHARTTVHGRQLIVERYRAGRPQTHIASAMGVCRRWPCTWVTRFETDGEAGLADRSSRPHTSPTRTAPEVTEAMVAARLRLRCGRDGEAAATVIRPRTVSRIVVGAGMPRLAQLDHISTEPIASSKQTTVRYERARPAKLVHMDPHVARPHTYRRRVAGGGCTGAPSPRR